MKMLRYYCIAFFLLTILSSCSKDDDGPTLTEPVMINFETPEVSIQKSKEKHEIRIPFDQRATQNGIITIQVASQPGVEVLTTPEIREGVLELEVLKGERAATFLLHSQKMKAGDSSVSFEISDCSEGFHINNPNITAVHISDDTPADDDTTVSVTFAKAFETVYENDPAGIELELNLSNPAKERATLSIQLEGETHNTMFRTEPAMDSDGIIELTVAPGDDRLSFLVFPQDDELLTSHLDLSFLITETTHSLAKGELLITDLQILDDELKGKAKSSQAVGEHGLIRKTLEYNEQGLVSQVIMENDSFSHTHTYHYNAGGQLEKINYAEGQDQHFFWQNDRLLKSEKTVNGSKTSYCEYEYDGNGNIAIRSVYQQQAIGGFELMKIQMYNYHNNGNLLRILTHNIRNGVTQSTSTRSYESYRAEENLFPTEAIIPGISTQNNLPATYRSEEGDEIREYPYVYEFNAEGLASRRSSETEEVIFEYY